MARGTQARIEHLRKVPLLSSCSTKDLQRIASRADELTLEPGKKLAEQGRQGREAFVIVDGTCTVSRNGKKVATLGPGEVVGELSLLDHGPRTATVTADTPMNVQVLDQRHFMAVLD